MGPWGIPRLRGESMILTVTMNPSIDISYPLETLHLDTVNRVDKVSKTAGGKGLNVTRVLAEIGDPVSATGLIGGSTGQFILDHLDQEIGKEFFEIQGETRELYCDPSRWSTNRNLRKKVHLFLKKKGKHFWLTLKLCFQM